VQEAIKKYLETRNLNLQLVDCGYDYDVYLDDLPPVDAGTHHLKLADYLLEVKATTSGEVRLTPAQARTASEMPGRFILCVVDLRGITHERMEADWAAADVEPRTRIVEGMGELVNQPHALVIQATECDIGLRNDNALRYGVPVQVWEQGVPIATWVEQLATSLPESTPEKTAAPENDGA
jgi:hypothetical protein